MRPLAFAALLAVGLSSAACSSEVVGDEPATSVAAVTASYQRTVVFIYGQTQPGQNMFVRGGLDHAAAKAKLGYDCNKTSSLCAMPIKHRSTLNATTAAWKKGDTHLDWAGAETGQAAGAAGSPLDWTTNYWPADWGTPRTIEKDGYGVDPMNKTGMHTWKLDVDMDCSKGFPDAAGNRWFEL
jgi:alpha-amylase